MLCGAAAGLKTLLPPIEVIKGSRFNIDPENPEALDSFLEARLKASGRKFEDLVTEVIPSPFVQVGRNRERKRERERERGAARVEDGNF